jgi:cinnamyl-alcohol dehydrogenase
MVSALKAPAPDAIAANPREYSIYAQAQPENGSVDQEKLSKALKQYGSNGGEVPDSFDKLAKALHKPCSHKAPEADGNCLAFAARDESGHLSPYRFERRQLQADDIRIQIAFCGVCHSDLHTIKGEWGTPAYPIAPGHEIVGIVTEVGSAVNDFKVGEPAGVGCMVNSCGKCEECKSGIEQYCEAGPVWTYNSKDPADGSTTQGGYSSHVVVNKKFAVHFPSNLPLDAGAPLLCAGITTYSPLRHFGLDKPGMKLGVIGLGGLGHMAVKFGKAFGCEVTVISTSPNKKAEALKTLGADHFIVSKNKEEMEAAATTLNGIIDTVAARHDIASYLALLKTDGKLVMVGLPPDELPIRAVHLTSKRRILSGSAIGGIAETQEMLDFCGKHSITCDIELIKVDYINTAMERLVKNDVHYRFVIDVQGSLIA